MSISMPKDPNPGPETFDAMARRCFDQVTELRQALLASVTPGRSARVHPRHRNSAQNLGSYLELRKWDLRDLQHLLSLLGLSSLGRSEAHVMGTVDAVHYALSKMLDDAGDPPLPSTQSMLMNRHQLIDNADRLLGQTCNPQRRTRIMVTLPSGAAEDPQVVRGILQAGAEILRINTAHDDEAAWRSMVEHARQRQARTGRTVRISVDLAGPKVRIDGLRDASGKDKRKVRVEKGQRIRVVGDVADFTRRPSTTEVLISQAAVFEGVRVSDRIFFDDGNVGGLITEVSRSAFEVEVTETNSELSRLAREKGVNLPDTTLALPALSEEDRAALNFVVECADMVSLSFVRTPSDIEDLFAELRSRNGSSLGIVLKIELVEAFRNLPDLLIKLLEWESAGVMVARGDLAVEAGYLRLAELQEEIMWLCESAHVPVIWATEVLDRMSKTGHPSRAEITDAAMGARAECVMLNKGPHITESISFLDSILQHMAEHLDKKRSLMRQLRSWQ